MADQSGLCATPSVVAELGPGDSIGIGLAALLSGAERYFAFDIVGHASLQRNADIFEELVGLFRRKEKIPSGEEFPEAKPELKSYDFPHHILSDARLMNLLSDSRVDRIRKSLRDTLSAESVIRYVAPWHERHLVDRESVDMIFSQAVLEHVDDLSFTYRTFHDWLKPDGLMSHQIDFRCHRTAEKWNGHWAYSDLRWKMIRGRRPYLLNRETHSKHLSLLEETGFRIISNMAIRSPSELSRQDLAPRFRNMPEDDLTTSGAFIQAVKDARYSPDRGRRADAE
jgi:SAM-dependent methyltransferase